LQGNSKKKTNYAAINEALAYRVRVVNIFQDIIDNKIPSHKIWEDDKFLAILDVNPIKPGHILLLPKIDIDYVFDLEDDVYVELFLKAKFISRILKSALKCKRVGLAVEGFGVSHIHVHLVPINSGNELNPANAKPASYQQLLAMEKKLDGYFNAS